MVLSEDQIDVKVVGEDGLPIAATTYKDFDKMDDVMGHAWVEDSEEVWRLAPVRSVSSDGQTLFIVADDEETVYTVSKEKSHPFDPSHAIDMDDLAFLNNMHEAPLLQVLKRRFKSDHIYTICSDVLISINPYKRIPLLYDLDRATATPLTEQAHHHHHQQHGTNSKDKAATATASTGAQRPHVYSVAERAFRFMTEPKEALLLGKQVALKNQSIIISGESGAGKTEASKYVMRYLITVANALHSDEGRQEQQLGDFIERCLLRSNTVLEAFGNAKTLRNDNSSRFGKYIKLQYDSKRHLIGAWTDHFLLEKSRLVHVDWEERNYHIYYQMLRGLPQGELQALHLSGDPEDYTMLSQGGCCALEDVDDAQDFQAVAEALATLELSTEEVSSLWRLLAVLLHLGNLEYDWDEDENRQVQLISPKVALCEIADMMGTTPMELTKGICSRSTSSARGSTLCIPLTLEQTRNNVQALIKHAYGEVFQWLVRKINACHSNMTTGRSAASFIGILDIFGFEIMTRNSFEQLCINFANEVLQQQFNMHVFVLEQQEYVAEELDWSVISFRDNQPVIDLISKKPTGLLIMLEEQGMLARKVNNDALLTTYHNTHLGKVDCYAKPRFQSDEFIIRHFAGEVVYSVAGLIEKNNDSLHKDLLMLLHESDHVFFRNLVSSDPKPGTPGYIQPLPQQAQQQQQHSSPTKSSAAGLDLDGRLMGGGGAVSDRRGGSNGLRPNDRRMGGASSRHGGGRDGTGQGPSAISQRFTVSATFRKQLDDLTATLKMTEPHYIKCIKPNAIKAAGGFSPRLVVQQLRYSGVLEVVRIRREAYPTRIPFEEFYRRFDVLLGSAKPPPSSLRSAKDYRSACQSIVVKVLPPGGFQLGKRKIFLRDNGLDVLRSAIRDFFASHAARIQAQMRAFVYSRRYRLAIKRIRLTQRLVRMRLLRKRFLRYRFQILRIQTTWRRHQQRSRYLRFQAALLIVQTYTRRFLAIKSFSRKAREARLRAEGAATTIAAYYRGSRARWWRRTTLAAMAITSLWRGVVARRHYRRLRSVALIVAYMRGLVARRRYQRVRSATLLAAHMRGFKARREYRRLRSVALIVAQLRGLVARRQYRRLRSAILIAAHVRGLAARRQYRRLRSVALIVAQTRGLVARRRYAKARGDIITVQACWRARVARKEARVLRAAVRLQSAARAWAARTQFSTLRTQARLKREREERAAAICIQACWMSYCIRQEFLDLRVATMTVQKHTRRFLATRHKAHALASIVRIQTCFRRYRCRAAYVRETSAIALQARVRAFLCRRAYLRLLAAIRLQSWARGEAARGRYRRLRAAISIQAHVRGWLAQMRYRRLVSAIRIQAAIRGWLARLRYQRLRAAITIQAVARGWWTRSQYRRLRAAISIQACVRGWVARLHYRRLCASIRMQAAVRGWLARTWYLKLRGVVKLQALVRRKGPRNRFCRTRRAIRLLQKNVRYFLQATLVKTFVQRLHRAAEAGQVHLVAKLLQERPGLGGMLNQKEDNRTLIHAAAQSYDVSVLTFLSPLASDLMERDAQGNTPFLLACARSNLDVIKKCAAICDRTPTDISGMMVTPEKRRSSQQMMMVGSGSGTRTAGKRHQATPPSPFAMASGATPETLDDRIRSATINQRHQQQQHLSMQQQNAAGLMTPLQTPRRGFAAMTPRRTQPVSTPLYSTRSNASSNSAFSMAPTSLMSVRSLANNPTTARAVLDRLRSGWLKKRRETDRWQRRYCVLTKTELKYYHEPNDRTPSKVIELKYAMLRKCDRIDFCLELHSPLLLDRRNREGRLYFQAEDEMELQAWYNSLRAVTGHVSHMCGRRIAPISYGNPERRTSMIEVACNRRGESCLHAVASAVGRPRHVSQPIQVATWLIENGADVNAVDENGNTPAHVALSKGSVGLALAIVLVLRGADTTIRNRYGLTVTNLVGKDPRDVQLWKDALRQGQDIRAREEGGKPVQSPGANKSPRSHAMTPRHRVIYSQRPAPYRIPGCSYVSLFFEKLTMTTQRLSKPFLLVTVYSPKGHVVEHPQRIAHPAIKRPTSVWWGAMWYMYTPVENLTPGTFAVIEFRDSRGVKKPNGEGAAEEVLLTWTVVHLDDSSVDTTALNQEMYRPPVDLKLQRMEPADQFVSGDVCVSKADPLTFSED